MDLPAFVWIEDEGPRWDKGKTIRACMSDLWASVPWPAPTPVPNPAFAGINSRRNMVVGIVRTGSIDRTWLYDLYCRDAAQTRPALRSWLVMGV